MLFRILKTVLVVQVLISASDANEKADFKNCGPMSHNPKCWASAPEPSQHFQCPTLKYCTRINKVIRLPAGNYLCGSGLFDCTKIVAKFGSKAVGLPVLVSFNQIDTCHTPGRCGAQACKPFGRTGAASISSSCR